MKSLKIATILLFCGSAYSQTELQHFQKHKNRFKFGITDIARGNPSFTYEHLVGKGASIETGFGLTFDDIYAINYWDGHQYIKRNNFSNTRYSFSLGMNVLPIPNISFLYMGIEWKFRRYYSADNEFFHSSSGYFLGAKRSETITKFKIGNLFDFNRFVVDYSVGIGYLKSDDRWAYYDMSQYPASPYHSGKETVKKVIFSFDLKIGFSGKKIWNNTEIKV